MLPGTDHCCPLPWKPHRLQHRDQIGYGTTENSPVTFLGFPMDEIKRKTETVGYITPHTEVSGVGVGSETVGYVIPHTEVSGVGVSSETVGYVIPHTEVSGVVVGSETVGYVLPHTEVSGVGVGSETVGYVLPHTEAKVVNPNTGEIVPLNTAGELLIRGYCVMLGYWGDPTKTAESITTDRWYKTGDIASLDEYGYCKIEGRIRDMMIRGGENIYPAEIEQFLHTHPKVHEAQVIGVKDERMGEEVCACIKLMEGVECTAEEIKAFCKGQISHFKIPRYVLFMKKFPLTVSGKVGPPCFCVSGGFHAVSVPEEEESPGKILLLKKVAEVAFHTAEKKQLYEMCIKTRKQF
ncbi:hypothetical protein EOD39_7309 [Acipenser ruthenus]|uniref:Medium-chain acyl-CoA ligase ACSF2, mitochondrial n=1 Tax=Acipenser ruthenus TaxID=7906 RepID=A0A444U773_ACIRT|nr:hypothetical protein EOD39_7309 [Acipenser ruthenus]